MSRTPPSSTTEAERNGLRARLVGYRADRSLTGDQAAARISAFVYGNIVVFAAMAPLTGEDIAHGHALKLVLGVAVSTLLAHVFAELVGRQARSGAAMTRADLAHELRSTVPIASSAVVPCAFLLAAMLNWLDGRTAIFIAEVYLLVRFAMIGLLVERLRSVKASFRTLLSGLLLAAAAATIALLKVFLGH